MANKDFQNGLIVGLAAGSMQYNPASGTLDISENGEYDVENYLGVNVNIPKIIKSDMNAFININHKINIESSISSLHISSIVSARDGQ